MWSRIYRGALLLAIVGSACGGVTTPRDAEPLATTSGEQSTAADLEVTGEPLRPGRYTRAGFEPAFTFELDGSWQAVQMFEGFFDVQDEPGSADVVAVQFGRVEGVYGAEGGVEPSSAAEAVEILRDNQALQVLESSRSRIGGLAGSQITVGNSGKIHARVIEVPPGPLGIDPGRRLWIAFFDTEQGLIAVMVGGSERRWTEALAAAEPVLESVTFGS